MVWISGSRRHSAGGRPDAQQRIQYRRAEPANPEAAGGIRGTRSGRPARATRGADLEGVCALGDGGEGKQYTGGMTRRGQTTFSLFRTIENVVCPLQPSTILGPRP